MSKKLFKSTAMVSFMTLISRILGLAREVVFATFFGAGTGMDAFIVAFKIPNFLRRLFAEGAFAQAFVPIFSEYKEEGDQTKLKYLVQNVIGTLGLILFVVSVFGILFSSLWIFVSAPGFTADPAKFHLASKLLKLTFPYILFISLTALSGGILNCFDRFAVPAITPALLNLSLIGSAIFLSHLFVHPVEALAWGVLIAGVLQFAIQLPFLWRLKVLSWPRWGWKTPGVQKVLKLLLPALFGASVAQLSLLIDTIFASFLPTGSVSWLYYSNRLMQFPLGIFGVAIATVILPHLSAKHAKADHGQYKESLDWALRLMILLAIPASVGLIVLSGPLTVTIFNYGRFSHLDVLMSQRALIAFSLGLLFYMGVRVLVSAFYARQDVKTPVKIGVIAVATNIILNGILIWPLQYLGVALATSISWGVNMILLFIILWKRGIYKPSKKWVRSLIATLLASGIMGVALFFAKGNMGRWYLWGVKNRVYHMVLLLFIAAICYLVFLWLFGVRKRDLIR